jgi:hypothetical protein
MHLHQHRIDLCNRALDAVDAIIPPPLHADVSDYINKHDEWGVGMEMLIDQLGEFDIPITREQFGLIKAAMTSMGLAESDVMAYLQKQNVAG